MEVIISFIIGITIIVSIVNFLAIIGYITFKVRDIIYRKYKINILTILYYTNDKPYYVDYIFTGMFTIGSILSLIGLTYVICQLGNYIYSLF